LAIEERARRWMRMNGGPVVLSAVHERAGARSVLMDGTNANAVASARAVCAKSSKNVDNVDQK